MHTLDFESFDYWYAQMELAGEDFEGPICTHPNATYRYSLGPCVMEGRYETRFRIRLEKFNG